jgi:hypothetical protein
MKSKGYRMFRGWETAVVVAFMLHSITPVLAGAEMPRHDSPATGVQQIQTPASADAGVQHQRPLAPGATAGVRKAQSFADPSASSWLIGAGIVIGGVVLLTSSHSHGHASSSTTGVP